MIFAVPDAMTHHVEGQVATSACANASDYARLLIRHDQQSRYVVRAALRAGEDSRISRNTPDEILASLLREPGG